MNKKIVVMGGGNGNFNVLKGLKDHNTELTAIVAEGLSLSILALKDMTLL